MESIIMTLISPLLLPAIFAGAFAIMTGQKPQSFIKPLTKIYFSILKTLFGLLLTSIKLLWVKRYKGYLDQREPLFEEQNYRPEQHNSNIRIKVLDN